MTTRVGFALELVLERGNEGRSRLGPHLGVLPAILRALKLRAEISFDPARHAQCGGRDSGVGFGGFQRCVQLRPARFGALSFDASCLAFRRDTFLALTLGCFARQSLCRFTFEAFGLGGGGDRHETSRGVRRSVRIWRRREPEVSYRASRRCAVGIGWKRQIGLGEPARSGHLFLEAPGAEQLRDGGVDPCRVQGGLDLAAVRIDAVSKPVQGGVGDRAKRIPVGGRGGSDLVT